MQLKFLIKIFNCSLEFMLYYPRRPNMGLCASWADGWDGILRKLAS